jgi:hypothetical protein
MPLPGMVGWAWTILTHLLGHHIFSLEDSDSVIQSRFCAEHWQLKVENYLPKLQSGYCWKYRKLLWKLIPWGPFSHVLHNPSVLNICTGVPIRKDGGNWRKGERKLLKDGFDNKTTAASCQGSILEFLTYMYMSFPVFSLDLYISFFVWLCKLLVTEAVDWHMKYSLIFAGYDRLIKGTLT